MIRTIFINVPVKNLNKSVEFFKKLEFTFNPKFTNDKAACLIIGANIFAMLITEKFFKTFMSTEICDAKTHTEVLLALQAESKEAVDTLFQKAITAGGVQYKDPEDLGWMYTKRFSDLDGHLWELFYMDETNMPSSPSSV